jgi:hypothetical protein
LDDVLKKVLIIIGLNNQSGNYLRIAQELIFEGPSNHNGDIWANWTFSTNQVRPRGLPLGETCGRYVHICSMCPPLKGGSILVLGDPISRDVCIGSTFIIIMGVANFTKYDI